MKRLQFLFLIVASLAFVSCNSKNHFDREITAQTFQSRAGIVNGDRVKKYDPVATHVVAITDQAMENCTGTLIAKNLVLTAAHCQTPDEKMYIAFGLEVSPDNIQKINLHEVTAYRMAPGYQDVLTSFKEVDHADLMILQFDGEAPAGYEAAEILNDASVLFEGMFVTVAGYGVTDGIEQEGDGFLRKTQVSIANPSYARTEVSTDETMHGSCSIDSGGPAFVEVDGKTYIWGVTSRGDVNCRKRGVYTRIDSYLPWVDAVIKELSPL
ncbi:MAG TPA: trypsin-like serine protease [Pseudobdellovibrionaceae bacterium]|jgi:V8-like Glu-specific endopeptidase